MDFRIDRRTMIKAGAALAAAQAVPVWAQEKPLLRMTGVFSDKDIRADMFRMIIKDMEADFRMEPYFMGSLFKQGTELVALQRDNVEIANIAPQDISKQLPAWSVLTSAYSFRDANHVLAFFKSDVGTQMVKQAEDQLKIKVLGPTFFGTRQVGLKPKKKVGTPADLAGIKLRMPAGDAWQLLGRSLGANPTPIAYAETYTALQTGAVDGQDNPLPNVQNMKFYEVMSQIVLTSHLVAFDVLCANLKTLERDEPRPSRRASRPRSTRRWPGACRSTSSARRNSPTASRSRASTSTRRISPRSAPTRRRSISPPTRRRPGRRGSSTGSLRSSSDGRASGRGPRGAVRDGPRRGARAGARRATAATLPAQGRGRSHESSQASSAG